MKLYEMFVNGIPALVAFEDLMVTKLQLFFLDLLFYIVNDVNIFEFLHLMNYKDDP